jgi:hypothetical protein
MGRFSLVMGGKRYMRKKTCIIQADSSHIAVGTFLGKYLTAVIRGRHGLILSAEENQERWAR